MSGRRYQLSGRQRRLLDVIGEGLRVALPIPPAYAADDPYAYARAALDVEPSWIRGVVFDVVAVRPSRGAVGLAAELGAILTEPTDDDVRVSVVVVALRRPGTTRPMRLGVQWPGGPIAAE